MPRFIYRSLLVAESVVHCPARIEKGAQIVIEFHVVTERSALSFPHLCKKKLRFPNFLVYA
jgi:hypothetical protein